MSLETIGQHDLQAQDLDLVELFRQIETLSSIAAGNVRASIATIALRSLEMAILCDHKILDMSLNPSAFLGADEGMLRRRMEELLGNESAPDSLVSHLLMQIRSGTAGATSKTKAEVHFGDVVDRHPASVTSKEFRCQACGYHFTKADLGEVRQRIVLEAGLTLAPQKLARRIRDLWKPAKFTECTLDHIVPEAGLGGTLATNLRILCKFCNHQKQLYRWPGETLARSVAASFLALGDSETRGHWAVQAAAYVAIHQVGECVDCGATRGETELTATTEGARGTEPALPWRMRCVCYDCFDPSG